MALANFNFIGKHPSSILIMGGILLLILGFGASSAGNGDAEQLYEFGGWLIGIGIFVHILWLLPRMLRH